MNKNKLDIKPIDLVPAFAGLIGKVALVSSFAFVWASELNITAPNFVFDNVRIEIILGSLITLIAAFFLRRTAPSGTLAPLIVLIPTMVGFGVHPMMLSILVGITGIISVKIGLLKKLVAVSGNISKTSVTLAFGISGVILSLQKLLSFFSNNPLTLFFLLFLLTVSYALLLKLNKAWLIIPVSAALSLILPLLRGISIDISAPQGMPNFNPFYWWNEMWGIGFGLDIITIIKTLPFALFVMLLWAIDTVSINEVINANYKENEKHEKMNTDNSFIIAAIRNFIGGICGGSQTSALWRSFLIPLFMIKRPIFASSVLLGIIGIVSGITAIPIKILSFPPMIWTVLMFGIFSQLVRVAIMNTIKTEKYAYKIPIIAFTALGIVFSPIITWVAAILYEKICKKLLT